MLLGAQIAGVDAFVDSMGVKANGPTLAADHLVAVIFLDELMEGRLQDATLQRKYQVQGRRFKDVVFCQSAAIFPLFAHKKRHCWSGGMSPRLGY